MQKSTTNSNVEELLLKCSQHVERWNSLKRCNHALKQTEKAGALRTSLKQLELVIH